MSLLRELWALIKSFGYAFRGIGYGIKTQRNLRIHLVALLTVVCFNTMARFSVTHWCIELLCCMIVISLELVNTALEAVCDQVSPERQPLIGHAKDAAAGAVLVSAVGAAGIAFLLFFFGGDYRENTLAFLRAPEHGWVVPALIVGYILAAGFVFLPAIRHRTNERNKEQS